MGVPLGNPVEDAGADTAHRYQFQYCCAAARLLAGIATDVDREVLCEWHEDFLVVEDDRVEAVSVKHREDHLPAWSIPSLASDGKLEHLLGTFQRGDRLQCCFETNRPHTVHALWDADRETRNDARSNLTERLNGSGAEVDDFLDHLVITTPPVPSRQYIELTYAAMHAAPALDRLGIQDLPSTQAMRIAASIVARASRDQVPDDAWTALLAASPSDRASVLKEHQLVARRVSTDELRSALEDAAKARVPRLGTVPGDAPPETTLTKKLEDGGLGPSVVDSARRRRRLWYSHTAEHRDLGDREAELRSLQEWVQDQANTAEIQASQGDGSPYGPRMYEGLMTRLQAQDLLPAGTRTEDRDPALLSGAAFELTDACSVWWAPRPAPESDDNS